MEIYQSLELLNDKGEKTGLYHYTCSNSRESYAVGYCSPVELCPDCKGRSGVLRLPDQPPCGHCSDKGILRKENPCPGHATPEEARQHYEEFLLDHARYAELVNSDEQHKCKVCGTWTQGIADLGEWRTFHLCDEHRNREGLAQAARKKD